MNKQAIKSEGIRLAAALARYDGLTILDRRVENQKTISTCVVDKDLEVLRNFMRVCSRQMRKMADLIETD